LVSRDLLSFLWAEYQPAQREYLIDLMQHMTLLCPWATPEAEMGTSHTAAAPAAPAKDGQQQEFNPDELRTQLFLVPSLLTALEDEKDGQAQQAMRRYEYKASFVFSFLPKGVFERLLCAAVGYASTVFSNSAPPKVTQHFARLSFGLKDFALLCPEDSDEIVLAVKEENHCANVLEVLTAMLKRISEDFLHDRLALQETKLGAVMDVDGEQRLVYAPETAVLRAVDSRANIVYDQDDERRELAPFLKWLPVSMRGNGTSNEPEEDEDDVMVRRKKPLPDGCLYHFFLSHRQKDGGDQVATLYHVLTNMGYKVWYDNYMDKVTEQGMKEGVLNSKCLVLFLTKGVFEPRKKCWVRYEVWTALRAHKPIILMNEQDQRKEGYADLYEVQNGAPEYLRKMLDSIKSIRYEREGYLVKAMVAKLVERMEKDTLPQMLMDLTEEEIKRDEKHAEKRQRAAVTTGDSIVDDKKKKRASRIMGFFGRS